MGIFMFFQQETLAFQIFDVLYLKQGYSETRNTNRHYDALSFRLEADTVIDDGATSIHMKDGSVAYFPSNVPYRRQAKLDNVIVVHFKCFNFSGSRIEHYLPENSDSYKVAFTELLSCWQQKEPGYIHRCSGLFCQILAMLYRDHLPDSITNSRIEPSIRYLRQAMLQEDFSLSEAAKRSFVSQVYFRKLFKEAFGVSLKQYVIQHRIQHAASLILSGAFSLQEIAEQCGYRDYKHFTTEFKRITGVSPSQYEYNHP